MLLNTVVDLSRYDSEPATQCAMQLLIYCAHPKFVHVTRTLPPAVTLGPARRHDVQILQCLSSIMGHDDPLCMTCRHPNTARCCHSLEWVHAADLASRQAQLPMRLGGFGLTSMETISSIGYLSGFAHTMIFLASAGQTLSIPDWDLPFNYIKSLPTRVHSSSLISFRRARAAWNCVQDLVRDDSMDDGARMEMLTGVSDIRQLAEADGAHMQTVLTHAAAECDLERLRNRCDGPDLARLNSCNGYGAMAFLKAIPTSYDLMIPNTDMRVALRFMLHLPQTFLLNLHRFCDCLGPSIVPSKTDIFGDHFVVCIDGRRTARHNLVANKMSAVARLVGLHVGESCVAHYRQHDEYGIANMGDRSQRQPDKTFSGWTTDNRTTLVDFGVCHPCSTSHIAQALSGGPGAVAAAMELHKTQSAVLRPDEDFRDGGPPLKPDDAHYRFSACCFETYGAFGPDAQALTTDIADHAEQTAPYLDFGANWAAPDIAATARCMVSIAIRIGVSQQLRALADLKSSRPYFACPQRTQRRRGVATSRTNPNVARM